jgi:hypothetical protein
MTNLPKPTPAKRSFHGSGAQVARLRLGAVMRRLVRVLALCVGGWMFASPAWAQAPVALVEDIAGNPNGVSFMDYVQAGTLIQLGPQDTITLSYFSSCLREVIHGGSIRVGADQSEVASGRVERAKVDCEATKMLSSVGQTNDSASLTIRGDRPAAIRPAPPAEFTLYGASPFVELRGNGTLVIARLDRVGEYFALPIEPRNLLHGAFLDLAVSGKSLTPGGVYGVRWQKRLTVFKIDLGAKPGRTPIVGRLLRLESAS